MARTIKQIYDSMITEKQTFSSLDSLTSPVTPDTAQNMLTQLTSTSKVAIWRLMFWVCAFSIWSHEKLWDVYEAKIEARALELIPGTLRWWTTKLEEFQYGYSLQWDGEKWAYATISTDTDIVIISQAAAIESNGEVVLKVARDDGSGSLTTLNAAQETALEYYIDAIKPAGILTRLINATADLLKLQVNVYIDPTLIYNDESIPTDPLNGSLLTDATIFPIQNAINDYIESLDFNGRLYASSLIDAIQSATGVTNVVLNTLEAKYGALSYTDILATTSESYNSNAGYLSIDPSFPLTTQITYYNS